MTDRFEAWCMCPGCGVAACHRWRLPKPKPTQADLDYWQANHEEIETCSFGGEVVSRHYWPPKPVDESMFEVIRQCVCGREWGNI